MLSNVWQIVSSFFTQIVTKAVSYLAAFAAGWGARSAKVQAEELKEARDAEEAWRNKPRNKRELIERLRLQRRKSERSGL